MNLNEFTNKLEEMQNMTFNEVKDEEYSDYDKIHINIEEDPIIKCLKFLEQTNNPFFFKVGDIKVKNTYKKDGININDAIKNLIRFEVTKA